MSTVQDADIANDDIARQLQRYRFVSPTRLNCIARIRIAPRAGFWIGALLLECVVLFFGARLAATAHQSLSPDAAGSENRDVFEVLAPNQTVVPVAVTEVLVLIPGVWLRQIVFAVAIVWMGGEYGCALIEIERDVALQANRKGAIGSGSEQNCPTTCCGRGINCFINSSAVEGFSVAPGAKLSNIEGAGERSALLDGIGISRYGL